MNALNVKTVVKVSIIPIKRRKPQAFTLDFLLVNVIKVIFLKVPD